MGFHFVSFGADPLGGAAPQTPRDILKQAKAVLVFALGFGAPALGATEQACSLVYVCSDSASCEVGAVELRWSQDAPDILIVNGVTKQVTRFDKATPFGRLQFAQTEVEIRATGPVILGAGSDRRFVHVIKLADHKIRMTVQRMPMRYLEYEKAMANAMIYQGPCEGLF
ncbi:MAG: hypothetical protein AAGK71_06730 [Pseudomonadota bacterium]